MMQAAEYKNSNWRKANLGLGGNVGDPARQIARAIALISGRDDCHLLSVSKLYRTPPWGKTDQDWFFNACIEIETVLTPDALLALCLETERQMNRVRIERWGPRTLDIDVLTFEGVEQEEEHLLLPHPRIAERAFVLKPLSDYAPDLLIGQKPVAELLKAVNAQGIEAASDDDGWWRELSQ